MSERLDVISDLSSHKNRFSLETNALETHRGVAKEVPILEHQKSVDLSEAPSSHEEYKAKKPIVEHVTKIYTKDEETVLHSSDAASRTGYEEEPEKSLWDLKVAIFLCIITSFSGFIFGWDVGTIGGLTNMNSFQDRFGNVSDGQNGNQFSSIVVGLIISIFNIGCAVGGLSLSKLGDLYGRKLGILSSIMVYIVGLVIQITSKYSGHWIQMFFGRIITGLAVGSTSVLTPMFISENAPLKIRGAMVVLYQLMITLGILMGNVVNFICKRSFANNDGNDDNEWMIPIGLCFVWAALISVGILFMPESPIYLVNIRDDYEGALKSIAKLNNTKINDVRVAQQVGLIHENHERIKREVGDVKWNEFIYGKPKLFIRLIIGMLIMFCQQFSGANYFFYYGTTLFNSVGIEDSYITSIILGGVNFVSTFGGIYFVEKFGRKACLLVGSIGMGLCMAIYSSLGSFLLKDGDNFSIGIVMILFTCVYIFFFAATWGPVSFVVVSELFPVRVRNTSMSISTSVNWFANFIISLFTPYVVDQIGFRLGYVFVASLIFSGVFVWYYVPETKGLNIEDVDALYEDETI